MKSVMTLSMHKAGSSIADRVIGDFCVLRGYGIDRIAAKVPASPLSEVDVYRTYQPQMRLDGIYYGVARHPDVHDMEILPKLRLIAQVRDPRDCITSLYFSLRESHVPPRDPEKLKAFMEHRKKVQGLVIDDYAVREAPQYARRLRIMADMLQRHPDILLLRYEEMVEDTRTWLDRISAFLDQPLTDDLLARLGDKIVFRVDREDPASHKRQITPGDHRRKLQPETVRAMNAVLADQLAAFGYAG